jgi:hypothetical protein
LQSDAATRKLDELAPSSPLDLKTLARLRDEFSPERASAIAEQLDLRKRAQRKFSQAARLLFTRTSLEQATDECVAKYKAGKFPPDALAFDLCCGIGGDLMALAGRGPTIGFDRQAGVAALAAANLRATATHPWLAVAADAACVDVRVAAAWHIDPDRRPLGRRTTRVEAHEPSLETLDSLLAANANGAIKLAPAAEVPVHWAANAALEWISSAGECRQLVAWFGALADPTGRRIAGQRSATIVDGNRFHTIVGQPDVPVPAASQWGRFAYEPDAAVLAARLTGALAQAHGLAAAAPPVAYLTSDVQVRNMALAAFEVQAVMPFDLRRVKAFLREGRYGRLEVKKRGVSIDPEKVRQQLRVPGDESISLLIAPGKRGTEAILARRQAPVAESG